MRFSVECAFSHLGKRGVASRKSAFWQVGSWKSALWPRPQGTPHQKTHSGGSGARRVRLSVTSNSRMRFSVECAFPHLGKRGVGSRKSAFWQVGSRKSALWLRLRGAPHGKMYSGWGVTSRMRLYVSLHRRNARRRLGPAMQRETSEREVRRRRGPGRRPGPRDAARLRPPRPGPTSKQAPHRSGLDPAPEPYDGPDSTPASTMRSRSRSRMGAR